MRFCQECNNMLFPKEDRRQRKLLYVCRQCDFQEEATQNLVYRHELKKKVSESVMKDVLETFVDDNTLPKTRTAQCRKCHGREATFFQNPFESGDSMSLFFVCLNPTCRESWKEGGTKSR